MSKHFQANVGERAIAICSKAGTGVYVRLKNGEKFYGEALSATGSTLTVRPYGWAHAKAVSVDDVQLVSVEAIGRWSLYSQIVKRQRAAERDGGRLDTDSIKKEVSE